MAFSMQPNGRGRRRGWAGSMSEINVVPLVDVVLVLLVIFMLTAHVMEFGLEVDVPKVRQVKDSAEELPVVTVTKSGELYLNENQVNINLLASEVRRRFPQEKSVYVRADGSAVWDPVAQVISALSESQLETKLVTQPADSRRR